LRRASALLPLAPLLLATSALIARECLRNGAQARAAPAEVRPMLPPPALFAPAQGTWSIVSQGSALELTERAGAASATASSREVRGELELDPAGDLARLDVDVTLDETQARELLGAPRAVALRLHAEPVISSPSIVPGVRQAEARARLELDGSARDVALRAFWMPLGPARLRLQLEARWEGDARGEPHLLDVFAQGGRRSTLALDLALARS
jgi:hypothetical protein